MDSITLTHKLALKTHMDEATIAFILHNLREIVVKTLAKGEDMNMAHVVTLRRKERNMASGSKQVHTMAYVTRVLREDIDKRLRKK